MTYCPWARVFVPYCMANTGHLCRHPRHITQWSSVHTGAPSLISITPEGHFLAHFPHPVHPSSTVKLDVRLIFS